MNNLLNDLNPQQQEAVKKINGPSLILAGAGSGKTRVLVYKVLNLLENKVDSKEIVMITFTNKAANEMKERIFKLIGKSLGFIGTFHSFCCLLLRRYGDEIGIDNNFVIYDEDDQISLLKKIIKKKEVSKYSPRYFLSRISAAKNLLIDPEKYLETFSDYQAALVAEIYFHYQKELAKNKALDFDDLIGKAVVLLKERKTVREKVQMRYRYLLVDEFQDTNYAQYFLTRLIGEKSQNVTAVGDFSQSIYSWRGADIKNLEKFQNDFKNVKVFNLEQNYRSTQKILDFAYEIISQNETHTVLQLFTKNNTGDDVQIYEAANEEDEARFVAQEMGKINEMGDYSKIAVLYRTNAQSRVIEETLLNIGLPYILIGGTRFYERREIKDVLAYLRLILNFSDEIAQDRIKKLGKRRWLDFQKFYLEEEAIILKLTTTEIMEKIFLATKYLQSYDPHNEEDYARLENIKELKSVAGNFPQLTQFLEQVALVEAEYSEGEKKNTFKNGVRLMTLHQAKGLEFDHVFITGVEEGILPHSRSSDDLFQLEEERRLFYVGITRAKQKLFITHAKRRFIFGRRNETTKSRFLGQEENNDFW